MAALQKNRTSLVELRTSTGSVYAKPSFWERVYLLWMFRNFYCLPKEVLSVHQRRLIDKLCREAVGERSIAQTDIIGIVENVRIMPMPKADVAVAASNLIEMAAPSAEIGRPRAVAAGGMPMQLDGPADRSDVARLIAPLAKVAEIPPPKSHAVPQDKISSGPATETKAKAPTRPLAWVLAGAFVAAAIGILFHLQTQARPVRIASVSPAATEATAPAPVGAPATPVALSEAALPSAATDQTERSSIPESKPSHLPVASLQPESKRSGPAVARLLIATPVVANQDSTQEPRLQIAQPPESGFRYPEAPSSTLNGKVKLRAVIGTDGTVRKVDVLSGNRTLAVAAVQAVRHWRYPAPEMNGRPVEGETNIAITFVGDDAVSVSFPAAR